VAGRAFPGPSTAVRGIARARLLTHRYAILALAPLLLALFGFSWSQGFPDLVEAVSTPLLAVLCVATSAHAWRYGAPSVALERCVLFGMLLVLVAATFEPVITGRFEIGYPYVLGYAPLAYAAAFLFFGPRVGAGVAAGTYFALAIATLLGVTTAQIPPVRAVPLVGAHPILIGLLYAVAWTMAHVQREHRLAERSAALDPLTGALNRRSAGALLDTLDGPFALLVVDLDAFKRVNDEHGHAVGDAVLARSVAAIRSVLRNEDHVARWGGDEFVAILPGAGATTGRDLAARVTREVENACAEIGLSVRASVGAAERVSDEPWGDVFDRADAEMYEAKADRPRDDRD
jgi:diguanylate cyclase (GGDEF)-like protein